MIEQKKYSPGAGIIGCLVSVLLIVSFFLPRIWKNNTTVESFNTLLIVVILCLCVHLVRKTSALYFNHVWNSPVFTLLLFIPVINLVITASQMVWDNLGFMQHPLFTAFLVLISLPAFCCYYFNCVVFYCVRDKNLLICTIILDVFGIAYILTRIADRSVLPMVEITGHNVAVLTESLFSVSPYFSFIIYLLALADFIICARLFNASSGTKKNN